MSEMFKQETPATPGEANTQTGSQPDALATLLSEIRNENGEQKYKDPFEAIKALKHSQAYIPQLKNESAAQAAELERLRAEAARIAELEETVRTLTQRQEAPATKQEFDESKIEQLIQRNLTRAEQQRSARANQEVVEQALVKQFGEKAGEVFFGKAKELGMDATDIQALAAKSPSAVLSLFGVSGAGAHKQPSMPPAQTRLNTAAAPTRTVDTYIGRETETIPIGGGHAEAKRMMENARAMVDELHEKGMTVDDLTIPANYFKHFN